MINSMLSRPERITPLVVLALALIAFLCTPLLTGTSLAVYDVYNTLQSFALYGLLALAIGLSMMGGEFDISVVGTYALGGMVAVQLGESYPVFGVFAAVGCGIGIGAMQGGLIAGLRIPSLPVTLATYIALQGLTYAISGGLSVTYSNFDVTLWVNQVVAGIFTPRSLITVSAFLIAALALGCTQLGPQLRAIGGERRASRVAGIRVERGLLALFMATGALAALGGALIGYSLASADPNPGLQPLLIAIIAALLGGTALTGGRGAPIGLLAGALAVALLAQIGRTASLPTYWTQLSYAVLLAVVVAIDSRGLHRGIDRLRARGRTALWRSIR